MGQEEPQAAIPTHRTTPTTHNRPRCTLARTRPARNDDQREGARQGPRPATEEEEKHHSATLLDCGGENHPYVRCAAPARLRERVSSPVAVDAAPREGSKKSLRACCHLQSGGRQTTDSKTTTPLPPRLHPYGEKTTRGSVARPTLHRPHERALSAESRGQLVGRIAGTYL